MRELMMNVALGDKSEDTLTSLANRVSRLDKQMTEKEHREFTENVGASARNIANNLLNAFDEDVINDRAKTIASSGIPSDDDIANAQKELIKEATQPFFNSDVRDFIENIRRSHDQIIDTVTLDSVIFAGFDSQKEENADKVIQTFKEFIEDNKNEIIALRIIYNEAYKDRPMVIEQLKALYEKLKKKNITIERLWDCYYIKYTDKVKRGTTAQITDLISIIRFEIGATDELTTFSDKVNANFKEWTFKKNAGHTQFTEEQMEWLRLIKDHIISSLSILDEDLDYTPFDHKGGLLGFYEAFGDNYKNILNELNAALVA